MENAPETPTVPRSAPASGTASFFTPGAWLNRVPTTEFNAAQTVASRADVEAFVKKTGAQLWIQQRSGHTLQTTALLHEAYLRLAGGPQKALRNRAHFFGLAATAMRHILVDHARTRHRMVVRDALLWYPPS